MTHDAIYLREACRVAAAESQDPRTQNGALLRSRTGHVITAANQFPNIVITEERRSNNTKYSYIEHAERHVIYRAARHGIITHDATLYCPWFACSECARAIILAGVSRVVGHIKPKLITPERWQQTIAIADTMFNEAGVETILLDEPLDVRFMFNGEFIDI
jgi:dCMP deaminase